MNNDKSVCYLCGRKGADTTEHVIPRQFLPPGNFNNMNRFTLPAHRECNGAYSKDEEYVRDLIAPATELLNLAGAESVVNAANRSLRRDPGLRRRQHFLRYAKSLQLRDAKSGLFVGPAMGVPFNRERVDRVGRKIARGAIFKDTGAIISDDNVKCYGIPLSAVPSEREEELKKENFYWIALGWRTCAHDLYAPSIAIRRAYIGQPTTPITIDCIMGIMLLSEFYIVMARFPLPVDAPQSFQFSIDTESGGWIKGDKSE